MTHKHRTALNWPWCVFPYRVTTSQDVRQACSSSETRETGQKARNLLLMLARMAT